MNGGRWYRFDTHGRIPVTLFDIDGVKARSGGAGTKRFREELARGEVHALAVVRRAIELMPEVRSRWPWPTVPRPAGLRRDEEREVTVEALLLAAGHPADDVLRLAARYRGGSVRSAASAETRRRVERIAPERSPTRRFTVNIAGEREVHRREGELVERFIAYLDERGLACERLALPVEDTKLYNDVYVPARNQLIEAKGGVRRESVRMAIGQLADYSFQIGLDEAFEIQPQAAILFPERPPESVLALLDYLEIAAVWEIEGAFVDNRGGAFT